MMVFSSCTPTETKADVNDVRKSRSAFISTRRWPKLDECNNCKCEAANSFNKSAYPVSMLLRYRPLKVCNAGINLTMPMYNVRSVAQLPSSFQTPEWQHRNPISPPPHPAKQRCSAHDTESMTFFAPTGRHFLYTENMTATRLILNKLTAEKFEAIFEELVSSGLRRPHDISTLMIEIFDKATKHHHLIPMYADLFTKLEQETSVAETVGGQHSFRQLLSKQSQAAFEHMFVPNDNKEVADEEISLSRKQQALGKVKLIGHLLMKGMLASEVMVHCAEELLSKREFCPEALESLAALLMVAGPSFDNTAWEHHSKLEDLFTALRKVTKSKSTPSRVRFILRDVLDVRDAGWPNCKKENRHLQVAPLHDSNGHGARGDPTRNALDATPTKSNAVMLTTEDTILQYSEANDKENLDNALPFVDQLDASLFDVVAFRRILAIVLSDLITNQDIAAAVNRIRLQQVPFACQADQVVDILTRVLEEKRGPHRRRAIAFVTGLVASEQSAFDRKMFINGIDMFFKDVYDDLCHEVPRLTSMIATELVPVLLSVFSKSEISGVLPTGFYCPGLRA